MKIGVFDSGVGGESVANAIRESLPQHEVLYRQDKENVPYGTKSPTELHSLVLPILLDMVSTGCDVIVVACNSVTTTIIEDLRKEITIPLIGIEPMVKTASELSRSRIAAVCATPTTLGSPRYKYLKETYAKDMQILEPDCSDWAEMIEGNTLEHDKIRDIVESSIAKGADVIVMGCTHYHWIEEDVVRIADGRATVVQPEQPVIAQLNRVLERLA